MKKRNLFFVPLLLIISSLVSGCIIAVSEGGLDPTSNRVDLRLDWSISSSDSASLCAAYDVYRWRVSVRGPESFDLAFDCRTNWWSSENDLFALAEGSYTITVSAVDRSQSVLASITTNIDLFDRGSIERLNFDFRSSDFR